MANKNRRKGIIGEIHFMNVFKKLGFKSCVTSRNGSKMYDDCGVDLLFLPLNVQVKTGIHRGMKVRDVIKSQKQALASHPSVPASALDRPSIVIHKIDGRQNRDLPEVNEIVSMTFEDFVKLFKRAYINESAD